MSGREVREYTNLSDPKGRRACVYAQRIHQRIASENRTRVLEFSFPLLGYYFISHNGEKLNS